MGKLLKTASNNDEGTLYQLTDTDVERLHGVLLKMYKDIKNVCDAHGIRLVAAGGTALGAIRHNGFIPWDDDLDLFMLRCDFEKMQEIFEEELGDEYYLLAPGAKSGANCFLPRIMKKGTTLLNMIDEASPYPHGIYIDINIMEYAPDNVFLFYVKGFIADTLRLISYSVYWNQYKSESLKTHLMSSGMTGKIYYRCRMMIGILFSFRTAEEWFATFDKFVQNKKSSLITVPSGTKRYRGEVLKLEDVMPFAEHAFEDTKILIVNEYDKYLSNLYGNYMKIPKDVNRERHLCVKLDFENE